MITYAFYVVMLANITGHTGTVIGAPHSYPDPDSCEIHRLAELQMIESGKVGGNGIDMYVSADCQRRTE